MAHEIIAVRLLRRLIRFFLRRVGQFAFEVRKEWDRYWLVDN